MSAFSGEALTDAMSDVGMTDERLAIIIAPNLHTVAAYRAGAAQPQISTLIRIAAALGVEPAALLVDTAETIAV